jgi:hypothetical protein
MAFTGLQQNGFVGFCVAPSNCVRRGLLLFVDVVSAAAAAAMIHGGDVRDCVEV